MNMRKIFASLLFVCALMTYGQTETLPSSDNSGKGLKKVYNKVTAYFDSTRVKGYDSRYIEMPKYPWTAMVQSAFDQTDLRMSSTLNASNLPPMIESGEQSLKWEPRILTKTSTSVGAWVGYRGHGIGYAVNVGGDKGKSLTLTSSGKFYSVNFRYHTFKTDCPEVKMDVHYLDEETGNMEHLKVKDDYPLWDPIKARTIYLNGFYIFNYKKFSYAAARRQAIIQKRSAGSPIVGASFFHSRYAFANDHDAEFVMMMSKVGCIRQWQANICAGYSYNWVPAKGWLINATVLPSLSFYQKVKVSLYDSQFSRKYFASVVESDPNFTEYKKYWIPQEDLKAIENDVDKINQYIEEHKATEENPEGIHYVDPVDYTWETAYENSEEDFKLESVGSRSHKGRVDVNIDACATVAYQWSRYFVSAYAQFNTFSYHYSNAHGRINDWSAKASFGVRF